MNVYDYIDADFKVFGLHGVDASGVCGCGDAQCKALFKHPIIKNWQKIPLWSEDQIQTMEKMGHFRTGFGVLCDGLIVVDVDPRNGGDVSRLDIDVSKTFTVQTGGGGLHVYYKAPAGAALVSHHKDHPGIDFKSSGFVVGAGSLHCSGAIYEAAYGSPGAIIDAPAQLVELLRRPEKFRASVSGAVVDFDTNELVKMLSFISPDCDYATWIRCGMALHDVTQGCGAELWDDWSTKGAKYCGSAQIGRHWHSFGKSKAPVGVGTLIHFAQQSGYTTSADYVSDVKFDDNLNDFDDIDLASPPGFLGDLVRWINSQCRYPRESLAVAVALQTIGACAGARYQDELDDMSPNLICLCVAGSGTGKEAIQGAYAELLKSAGLSDCVFGGIKSEQELIRNLIRSKQSLYSIDEIGILLGKIANSGRTGAHYLQGVIGSIMSVYSKAGSYFLPSGDLKDETKKIIKAEISALEKIVEETGGGREKLDAAKKNVLTIDDGIKSPFLSLTGYTTPVTFDHLIDYEQATNGFLARALVFIDLETNPARKDAFKKAPMSDQISFVLSALAAESASKIVVHTDKEACALLDDVYDYFWQMADAEKGRTGLEAVCRRGYEIVAKISYIMSIPSCLRTAQDVRWAFALAKRDVDTKIKLAYANMAEKTLPEDSLAVKISKMLTSEHGETIAVICNRCRPAARPVVETIIKKMIDKNILEERADKNSKKKTHKIFLKGYTKD